MRLPLGEGRRGSIICHVGSSEIFLTRAEEEECLALLSPDQGVACLCMRAGGGVRR